MTNPSAAAEPDAVMARIGEGVELGQRGERAAARDLFAGLWDEIDDPLHRCALAHSMADVQDDVGEELRWDLRALEAAELIPDGGSAGFFPSLHLNLGDAYRRLGDTGLARHHLDLGRAAVGTLGDDGYGRMITGGLDRLAARLP